MEEANNNFEFSQKYINVLKLMCEGSGCPYFVLATEEPIWDSKKNVIMQDVCQKFK
jgi:hypothetical protein